MSYRSDYSYPGMEDLYTEDISGGWRSGNGGVFASPETIHLDNDVCGYWTFVSIRKHTW